MLEKIEIRTRQGTLLGLPLDDDWNEYIVQDVEGLGPVKATLVSSGFAGVDGEQYQSARREARNIKIKLGFEPDPIQNTVADLRDRLYSFLMPKAKVSLRFYKANGLVVDIDGVVESNEPEIFTQEPTNVVSIMCHKPDYLALVPVSFTGTTVSSTSEDLVSYGGTVETGIEFTMNVDRVLDEFTIYHRAPDDTIRTLDFSAPLAAGDVLFISTVTGAKGATLTRAGTDTPILYGVSPQSVWTDLMPGDNYIRVYAQGIGIPFEVNYIERYGAL